MLCPEQLWLLFVLSALQTLSHSLLQSPSEEGQWLPSYCRWQGEQPWDVQASSSLLPAHLSAKSKAAASPSLTVLSCQITAAVLPAPLAPAKVTELGEAGLQSSLGSHTLGPEELSGL